MGIEDLSAVWRIAQEVSRAAFAVARRAGAHGDDGDFEGLDLAYDQLAEATDQLATRIADLRPGTIGEAATKLSILLARHTIDGAITNLAPLLSLRDELDQLTAILAADMDASADGAPSRVAALMLAWEDAQKAIGAAIYACDEATLAHAGDAVAACEAALLRTKGVSEAIAKILLTEPIHTLADAAAKFRFLVYRSQLDGNLSSAPFLVLAADLDEVGERADAVASRASAAQLN